jgi:carbohydrate-binding DOMON domain-containing protein
LTDWKDKAGTTLLIFLLVAVCAFGLYKMAQMQYNTEHTIFVMNDSKGDDRGPGTYKYPIDSIFDPKKEHFDLIRFSFNSRRNIYYFDMSFPRVTNPWGAPEGFSHTMVQIYISDNPDNGRIEPFKPGSNVLLDPNNPWQYLIKVVSFNNAAVYWASDFAGANGRKTGVTARLQPDGKTIRVAVPKQLLPGDPYKWKYYVLVGSQDGLGPDNFRVVRAKVGQYNFGGGTDTDYSPNVIDLLAPPEEQKKMLGSFSVTKKTQAIIKPVGPSNISLGTWETFLDKIITVLQKLKVKL